MPKVTKKTREKAADFRKAKLKLGKGKQQPTNATDTSFKARSIALPGQGSLARAVATAEEPTTAGGLTLDEVLLKFRHPNSGVRKETLTGLKDILATKPGREVGKVVRALGGLVADDDAGVRKGLLGFMGWYLPSISESILIPHLPLLLLQTSSALSHIFPEVRLDACKLVALLLAHVPQHVVGTWPRSTSSASASSSKNTLDGGNIILEGLRLAVGLGGEKGATAAMGKLGANGRLITLKTLLQFVECALKGEQTDDIFAGWLEGSSGKGKGKAVEVGREAMIFEGSLVSPGQWAFEAIDSSWDISRLATGSLGDEDGSYDTLIELYSQLAPLLQSTFLESAPTAFSPSSSGSTSLEIPTSLCLTTASLTHLLARPILRGQPDKSIRISISDFLRRMAPYFPFRSTSGPSPSGLTPALELNLVYANLAILLAPPTPLLELKAMGRKEIGWRERVKAVEDAWKGMREVSGKGKGKKGSDGWAMDEVAEWVLEALAPSKDILAPQLTPATYSALLPIIWSLLVQPPAVPSTADDLPTSVGTAFFSHLARQGSSSIIRGLGDKFTVDLITTHEQRHPSLPFYIPASSAVRGAVTRWIESVPKTLWELGTRDENATGALIRILLDIGLRGPESYQAPYSLLTGLSFPSVAKKLAPFYHLHHPSKGSVPGPWTRLVGVETRRLGLDMAVVWAQWDDALRRAVDLAVKGVDGDRAYWTSRISA